MLDTHSHCLLDLDTSLCALTNTSFPSLLLHCPQSCLHRLVLPAVLTVRTIIFGLLKISFVFYSLRVIYVFTFPVFPSHWQHLHFHPFCREIASLDKIYIRIDSLDKIYIRIDSLDKIYINIGSLVKIYISIDSLYKIYISIVLVLVSMRNVRLD
jgi:hypothetical protein